MWLRVWYFVASLRDTSIVGRANPIYRRDSSNGSAARIPAFQVPSDIARLPLINMILTRS